MPPATATISSRVADSAARISCMPRRLRRDVACPGRPAVPRLLAQRRLHERVRKIPGAGRRPRLHRPDPRRQQLAAVLEERRIGRRPRLSTGLAAAMRGRAAPSHSISSVLRRRRSRRVAHLAVLRSAPWMAVASVEGASVRPASRIISRRPLGKPLCWSMTWTWSMPCDSRVSLRCAWSSSCWPRLARAAHRLHLAVRQLRRLGNRSR